MKYKVTISKRAEKYLDNVFDYLKHEWSEKVRKDFKKKLKDKIDLLRYNPYMFPVSQVKKGVRKCLITKHNAMYYQIKNFEVEIITIHDTRSNPESLKLQK